MCFLEIHHDVFWNENIYNEFKEDSLEDKKGGISTMREHYFKGFDGFNAITDRACMEESRVLDVRDSKWAHPEFREGWYTPARGVSPLFSQDMTREEKLEEIENVDENYLSSLPPFTPETWEHCKLDKYQVPGCPEEPETEAEVWVYTPTDAKRKNNRVMFYCMGCALVLREPQMLGLDALAVKYKAVLVTVLYRKSYQAEYPAALNDLHAGYQWMVEHAQDLKINPDKVVLHGLSSGGHLALSLCFRLKRYGYSPRGVVAVVPQTDYQNKDATGIYNAAWDTINQHDALMQYLGRNMGNSLAGPEALANFATVEECIGYAPTFIHTAEFDPDRNFSREFYGKLLEARTFAEFHCWGGLEHLSLALGVETGLGARAQHIIDENIEDLYRYDFRRPWVMEEYKEKLEKILSEITSAEEKEQK